MGPVSISMARYDTPPHAVHVRDELVDQAVQTITASDSLTAPPTSPNPLHLHPHTRKNSSVISGKTDVGDACA